MSGAGPLESSIAAHLRRPDRTPRHAPGTYCPPLPGYSARFDEQVRVVTTACFGVQSRDPGHPLAFTALGELRERFAERNGPGAHDRARYVDGADYTTTMDIGYWTDPAAFERWYASNGHSWTEPGRVIDGVGYFVEVASPGVERFETLVSTDDSAYGIGAVAPRTSGMIEEHGYWGSMRDRLPAAQDDRLQGGGAIDRRERGPLRTVRLHGNACLIRSGQDLAAASEAERNSYLRDIEPTLRAGMDFLRDEGAAIGCYDNRYMVVLDENDRPTGHTFGMSWWRDLASLEAWSASHPTHTRIFGAAMQHVATFKDESRLRLYHEVTVPAKDEQWFRYLGCHDHTGLLRARSGDRPGYGGRRLREQAGRRSARRG